MNKPEPLLDGAALKQVQTSLQAILLDLLDLSLVSKQAHWNLRGPRFKSIHEQLDEVVDIARNASDEAGERMVTVGVAADGRSQTVAAQTHLGNFADGFLTDQQAAKDIAGAVKKVTQEARAHIHLLGESDPISQDLVIGITADLEKAFWMLQAGDE